MAVSFGTDIPDTDGPSPTGERLAKVEGELAGIRHVQGTTKTSISLVVAVLLGGLSLVTLYNAWRFGRLEQDIAQTRTELGARIDRLDARMDRLEVKVDALPDRVSEQIARAVDLTLQAYRAGQGDRVPPTPPTAPR